MNGQSQILIMIYAMFQQDIILYESDRYIQSDATIGGMYMMYKTSSGNKYKNTYALFKEEDGLLL